ncbi:NAD(P) transhydrogenase subunit alpha [Flaviaesturariibacter aridisoli]|uniref:proton-translocating NAD(P)(+) transhydrogenase n=1 Tax=Flaviaesturariibacter aridisoli TaxID=2545761 RepID=A0A4R4E4E5_9BACT|nr:NAD(P) transhydrogenase subunit alpha [Flaviaesturariibacter aridisoli]TCZ74464.1 NAD(P) transhydrogenase subunit alpha [Flaviaesturariibacter aridisoli]
MNTVVEWISNNRELFYIVILMIFVGIEIIGRVPSVLHTPLMSGANAIHGVVIIGAIIVMGRAESDNYFALVLGFLAVVLGTLNVVGGFVVTDRMLEMFKSKKKK